MEGFSEKHPKFQFRKLYPKKGESSPLPFSKEEIAECTTRPDGLDIAEWIRFYLRHEVLGVESDNSLHAKRYDLHKFLAYFQHSLPGKHITAWDKSFTAAFRDAIDNEYNGDTLYRIMATVVTFAAFTVDWGVFLPRANPARRIPMPSRQPLPFEGIQIRPTDEASQEKPPIFSKDEIYGMFMAACQDLIQQKTMRPQHLRDRTLPLRDQSIMWILFNIGIRVSEVCQLRMAQKGPAVRSKGVWFYDVKCKGRKERNIFVTAEGTRLLNLYLNKERQQLTKLIPHEPLPIHVFLSWRAKKLERSAVWDIVQKVSRHASTYLPPGFMFYAHPHSFRHERGYLLRKSGEGDSSIAEQLGHTGLSQVPRYTQGAQGDEEDRIERIHYSK